MNIIQTEQKAMDMDLTQPEAWRDLEVTGPKTQFSFFSPVTGITQRAQKIDAGESREARDFFQRRGLNLQQHLDEVRGLDFDTARAAGEKQPVELDVNAFLARQQRAIVEATVAEANELTAKECYDSYIASMESDWAKTKQEFLDAMGFRRSGKSSTSLTIAPATSTALSAPFQGQPSSLSRDMIRSAPMASGPMVATDFRLSASGQQRTPDLVARNARATLMERLSRAQTTGERVPIVGEFERIQMSIVGDQKRRGERPRSHLFVMDCWDLLSEIVHERREADTLGDEARALYLSADKPLRRRLLRGARSYYERLFTNFVIDEVRKSSRSERGRGVSYLEDVRAFIKLENERSPHWSAKGGEYWDVAFEDKYKGYPLWPQVFYLFRSGSIELAIDLLKKIPADLSNWPIMISCLQQANANGGVLSPHLWKSLHDEYIQSVANSRDSFKLAMYNLVGRCEASPKNFNPRLIMPLTEDYTWLSLYMLWERDEPLPTWIGGGGERQRAAPFASQSQEEWQRALLRRGPAHFNRDGDRPFEYFKILLASMQFEEAIGFLVSSDHFVHGVHFAIAFSHYGLLRRKYGQPNNVCHPKAVDLAKIIQSYLQSILGPAGPYAESDLRLAFHYLMQLREPLGASGQKRSSAVGPSDGHFRRVMSDLVLMQREQLGVLVRDLDSGKNGCLFEYLPTEEATLIARHAAEVASVNGKVPEAVELYMLCEDTSKALDVLLQHLSSVIAIPQARTSDRNELQQLTTRCLAKLDNPEFSSIRPPHRSLMLSVRTCLRLMNFFDLYYAGEIRYEEALSRLDALNIFPAASSSVSHARAHAQSVRSLDSRVRRVFGDVALAAMEIVVAKYRDLERRTSGSGNPMTENILHILSAKGSSILQFLAATETHIRPDINTRISQLEITMAKHRKIMS
eukprot:97432_1